MFFDTKLIISFIDTLPWVVLFSTLKVSLLHVIDELDEGKIKIIK